MAFLINTMPFLLKYCACHTKMYRHLEKSGLWDQKTETEVNLFNPLKSGLR